MTKQHKLRALLAITSAVFVMACGGKGEDERPKVDPKAVEEDAVAILRRCFETHFNQATGEAPPDTSDISKHVDRLIRAFKADPDLRLPDTNSIKAKTLRGALEDTADTLDDCKPEDAARINEAL